MSHADKKFKMCHSKARINKFIRDMFCFYLLSIKKIYCCRRRRQNKNIVGCCFSERHSRRNQFQCHPLIHVCCFLTFVISNLNFFRELRCLRNTIHCNLFITYIFSALLWLLTLSNEVSRMCKKQMICHRIEIFCNDLYSSCMLDVIVRWSSEMCPSFNTHAVFQPNKLFLDDG